MKAYCQQILLLFLCAILWRRVSSSDATIYLTRPKSEPYFVSEGQSNVVLECSFSPKYSDRTRYRHSWVFIKDSPKHLTWDSASFMSDRYDLFETNKQYNLRIKKIEYQYDDGKFYCMVMDKETGTQSSAEAILTVMVSPGDPVIIDQPTEAVHEYDFVSISCQSTGGNPAPTFSWFFDNTTAVPKDWYETKPAKLRDQPSVSKLQWRVSSNYHEAYFVCQITSPALANGIYKRAKTNRLNVLYSPRVIAGPAHEYNVEEGNEVKLLCAASSNPPASTFEWYHITTGERHVSDSWSFTAKRKYSDEFRCKVTNQIGTGFDKLKLNVFYAPLLTVKERVSSVEGDSLTLTCHVDANPHTENVTWLDPKGNYSVGATLNINSLKRSDTGNYTCMATNDLKLIGETKIAPIYRTSEAVSFVDVQHRPGAATIETKQSVIEVGGRSVLTCSTVDPGSPPADYRWATPRSGGAYDPSNTSQIIVDHATLTDNGEYRCTPFNAIGTGIEGVFTLQVIELATIAQPLPENRIFNVGEATVSLSCEATGYPTPLLRWLKDGFEITGESNSKWKIKSEGRESRCAKGDYCSISILSVLRFTDLVTWTDKGNYTCTAENGFRDKAAYSSSIVSVIHEPVILNERYPTDSLAAFDVGATAFLVCKVSARPEPSFVWLRNSTEIRDGDSRYAIRKTKILSMIDEFHSILEIAELTALDYGPYLCRATNGLGSRIELIISLESKSKPHVPENVHVVSSSSSWILIGWRDGFNGGSQQKFQIELRRVDPRTNVPDVGEPVVVHNVRSNNATRKIISEHELGRKYDKGSEQVPIVFTLYNISKLYPLSSFWIRVRAGNVIGDSEWTPVTVASTLDVESSDHFEDSISLQYDSGNQQIFYQPEIEDENRCLLLSLGMYVSRKDSNDEEMEWRTIGCFTEDPIKNISPVGSIKARFCLKNATSICSQESESINISSLLSKAWLPIVLILIFLVFCLLLLLLIFCVSRSSESNCCKIASKKPCKDISKKLEVSRPLPQSDSSDTKESMANGSQNGNEIFTISSIPNGKTITSANGTKPFGIPRSPNYKCPSNYWSNVNDSYESNRESSDKDYCTQYGADHGDYHGSMLPQTNCNPFISRYSPPSEQQRICQIIHSSSDPDDSDGTSYTTNGGRRVMREIIV